MPGIPRCFLLSGGACHYCRLSVLLVPSVTLSWSALPPTGGLPLVEGGVRGRESGIGTTYPACKWWVWLPPGVTERFFLSRVIPWIGGAFCFSFCRSSARLPLGRSRANDALWFATTSGLPRKGGCRRLVPYGQGHPPRTRVVGPATAGCA